MFLGRYLKASFKFSELLTHFNENIFKLLVYFLFLSLVYLIPMNLLIMSEDGFRIDFIHQDFITETPSWNLPSGCKIEFNDFHCSSDEKVIETHQDVTYIFNGSKADVDKDQKQVIFTKDAIIYSSGEGASMTSKGYKGFSYTDFDSVNLLKNDERTQAYLSFANSVESSFSDYIVLYSILTNVGVNLFIQFIFILLLALVLQLFRFGYQSFPGYIDGLKFVILSMGLPVAIGLVVGLFEPAFGSVFFQLSMGLTVMIVMLKYGKTSLK